MRVSTSRSCASYRASRESAAVCRRRAAARSLLCEWNAARVLGLGRGRLVAVDAARETRQLGLELALRFSRMRTLRSCASALARSVSGCSSRAGASATPPSAIPVARFGRLCR